MNAKPKNSASEALVGGTIGLLIGIAFVGSVGLIVKSQRAKLAEQEASAPPIGDFLCTNHGQQSFLVEDVRKALKVDSAWVITTEGMVYDYTPRPGDACTLVRGGL